MTTRPTIARPAIARSLAALTLLSVSATALAQRSDAATTRPPRVGEVESAQTLLHYAVGLGVIALCVGVVVVPGRRDHDE